MVEPDIEDARDLIREKVDEIVDQYDSYSEEVVEHMTNICDLCDNADEDNWREIIEQIQDIAREHC